MKIENIKDVNGFFKVIDSCKGKVELVTGEGDRLNLKSKLSQYVSLANIFSNGEIPELEQSLPDWRHLPLRALQVGPEPGRVLHRLAYVPARPNEPQGQAGRPPPR